MATTAEVASGIRSKFLEVGIVRPMLGGREALYRVGNCAVNIAEDALHILKEREVKNIAFNSATNAITIYTAKRVTKTELKTLPQNIEGQSITYSAGGVETIGGVPAQAEYSTYSIWTDPATNREYYTCGSSISSANEASAGTLGALVRDQNGVLYGLTNNHVVGGNNHTPSAMPVVAPGVIDAQPGGIDPFTIGHFHQLLPLMPGDQANINVSLNLDAAIFKIKDPDLVSSKQGVEFDTPATVTDPVDQMIVEKVGRTTGHRVGRVVGKYLHPLRVLCENATYNFKAEIWFDGVHVVHGTNGRTFSEGGDSGSLVVGRNANNERVAVGIVFAGGPDQMAAGGKKSMILPLEPILQALQLTLVSGHNAS